MAFRPLGSAHLTKFNSSVSCNLLNDYSDYVDEQILKENSSPSHRTFAPSSFRCLRRQWFRIRGVQPDKLDKNEADKYLKFTAEIGTACHKTIQTNLQNMLGEDWIDVRQYLSEGNSPDLAGWSAQQSPDSLETLIELTTPPVRFACDGIVKINNTLYLLEIKTSEFSSFDELSDPKPNHIAQVEMYCTLLNLENVLFIYQDRQYGQMKCFEHRVSAERRASIWKQMNEVLELAENNICPDPLPKGDTWCSKAMCPYYVTCYKWGR